MCKDGLEIAEARLDLAKEQTEESGRAILSAVSALPSILTIRPLWEGGKFAGSEKERCELFCRLLPFASAVDIELDAEIRADIIAAAKESGAAIIVSRHNFIAADSLEQMDESASRAFAAGADVYKTAHFVAAEKDVAVLESFLQKWKSRPVVVIGMGDSDIARRTRLDFPAKGSRMTFALADENEPSAPGQLRIAETAAALRAK